jgi:hypothetical protein
MLEFMQYFELLSFKIVQKVSELHFASLLIVATQRLISRPHNLLNYNYLCYTIANGSVTNS